jgi:hypothetical protein
VSLRRKRVFDLRISLRDRHQTECANFAGLMVCDYYPCIFVFGNVITLDHRLFEIQRQPRLLRMVTSLERELVKRNYIIRIAISHKLIAITGGYVPDQ